jgi:hypothetical protein
VLNFLFEDTVGAPASGFRSTSDRDLLIRALILINETIKRARAGQDEATTNPVRLARHTVRWLNDLAEKPSKTMLELAGSSPIWPYYYSPKPSMLEEDRQMLENLKAP